MLDDDKHYWVGNDEVDKLVRAGGGWLAAHPEKELITRRYLAHRRELAAAALARLAEVDDAEAEQFDNAVGGGLDLDGPDQPVPLSQQRRGAVLAALRAAGARSVVDLGCGEGVLARELLAERGIEQVVGVDVSARALQLTGRRLRLDRMTERQRGRIRLFQSALTYRDDRLAGLDAAVLMEVIEHLDPPRLRRARAGVFEHAEPGTVVVTTPNAEYNVRFETLPAGATAPPRPPLRVDPRRVPVLGGQRRRRLRLRRPLPPGRDGRPGGRAADADGDLRRGPGPLGGRHDPRAHRPGAVPRRPDRRQRLGQVHVRARALPADRGPLLRRLPRPGRRRRERPVRHAARVRGAPLRRRRSGWRRAADGHRRHQRPARGAQAAGRAGPGAPLLPVAIVLDLPERVCDERNAARPDRDFGAARRPQPARRSCAAGCEACRTEGFRTVHVAARRGRDRGRERSPARAALERPPARARAVRRHRRRPRLLRRARGAARPARLRHRQRPIDGGPVDAHRRRPQGGLRRRPRRPRARTPPASCGW